MDEEVEKVKNLDRNITALGDVFDTVKESTERNTKMMTDSKTLTDQCIQNQRSMEKEIVSIKEVSENI